MYIHIYVGYGSLFVHVKAKKFCIAYIIYTHIYIIEPNIFIYIYIYTCIHTQIYIYIYIYAYVCICAYILPEPSILNILGHGREPPRPQPYPIYLNPLHIWMFAK